MKTRLASELWPCIQSHTNHSLFQEEHYETQPTHYGGEEEIQYDEPVEQEENMEQNEVR